jgi:hypothetical protein
MLSYGVEHEDADYRYARLQAKRTDDLDDLNQLSLDALTGFNGAMTIRSRTCGCAAHTTSKGCA